MRDSKTKSNETQKIRVVANTIRQDIIRMLVESKSGHPGGSLGMADVFAALYYSVLRHDPKNPIWAERDRLVLSNGHICPVLYATLANVGYFPKSELMTLRKLGSHLQGHPHKGMVPGIENSSGPLGQGISMAVGMALVGKREGASWRVYAIMGDGEQNEGQVWEAALLASKFKLDNLVAIIDRNDIQIDGTTNDVLPLEPLAAKYKSFGWKVVEVDGHDIQAFIKSCDLAKKSKGKPVLLICKTTPGKGVSFMEGKFSWHGKSPKKEEAEIALRELQSSEVA